MRADDFQRSSVAVPTCEFLNLVQKIVSAVTWSQIKIV